MNIFSLRRTTKRRVAQNGNHQVKEKKKKIKKLKKSKSIQHLLHNQQKRKKLPEPQLLMNCRCITPSVSLISIPMNLPRYNFDSIWLLKPIGFLPSKFEIQLRLNYRIDVDPKNLFWLLKPIKSSALVSATKTNLYQDF